MIFLEKSENFSCWENRLSKGIVIELISQGLEEMVLT